MVEFNDNYRVDNINSPGSYQAPQIFDGSQKKKKKKSREEKKESFETLLKCSEHAHRILEDMGSPYRFHIYEKEGRVYIDVVIIDTKGNTKEIKRSNISQGAFFELINSIEKGQGLFFDVKG